MNIRIATLEDAFAIQNIYRYYVDNTAITFELEVPSVKEFQERITKTLERYPYLVAEEEGEVIAYAYAGIFYDRRAYDWSAETACLPDERPGSKSARCPGRSGAQ